MRNYTHLFTMPSIVAEKPKISALNFSVNEMTEWVIALLEGYLGRIASNPLVKLNKLAKIAERSVLFKLSC